MCECECGFECEGGGVREVYSSLIGFTSCIAQSFSSRRSFVSSPLSTPQVYDPQMTSAGRGVRGSISHKEFITSFCKSLFPDELVKLSFIITNIKNRLTDLCGNRLLQNDLMNTFYGISEDREVATLRIG